MNSIAPNSTVAARHAETADALGRAPQRGLAQDRQFASLEQFMAADNMPPDMLADVLRSLPAGADRANRQRPTAFVIPWPAMCGGLAVLCGVVWAAISLTGEANSGRVLGPLLGVLASAAMLGGICAKKIDNCPNDSTRP